MDVFQSGMYVRIGSGVEISWKAVYYVDGLEDYVLVTGLFVVQYMFYDFSGFKTASHDVVADAG